jgi:hypothetical protein
MQRGLHFIYTVNVKHTALSLGDDVCSCSVVSACDGTVPLMHEPVPVPPVGQSVPHSPALT